MIRSLWNNMTRWLPEKRIHLEDFLYLWYVDSCDTYLAVEKWEFKIYEFEWWSYESIQDGWHEDETWWCDINDYFQGVDECMDMDTCEYSVLEPEDFETNEPYAMAKELLDVMNQELEDVSYCSYEWEEPSDKFVKFIEDGLKKIWKYNKTLVYCYYK